MLIVNFYQRLIYKSIQDNMKLQILQYIKDHGTSTPISFNYYPLIDNYPYNKQYSLKVNIKTQPGETNRKTVFICVPIFNIGPDEAMFKLLVILKKILKVHNLNMSLQR